MRKENPPGMSRRGIGLDNEFGRKTFKASPHQKQPPSRCASMPSSIAIRAVRAFEGDEVAVVESTPTHLVTGPEREAPAHCNSFAAEMADSIVGKFERHVSPLYQRYDPHSYDSWPEPHTIETRPAATYRAPAVIRGAR